MDELLEDSLTTDGDDPRSLVSAVSIGDLQQLFFLRVNRPYVGSYQCVATNRLGVVKSNNATLEVACKYRAVVENVADVCLYNPVILYHLINHNGRMRSQDMKICSDVATLMYQTRF